VDSTKRFTIEYFTRIDDVVYSQTAREAQNKAREIASLSTDGRYSIPSEAEFEKIIKPKEVE
jgi:hypothetical protein